MGMTVDCHSLRFARLLLLLLFTASTAQAAEPTEAEADSLRQRDDFVTASLLVVLPGEDGYSSLGHSMLRMECPAYGLDYCFSYTLNTDSTSTSYLRFLYGGTRGGLLAIETPDYLRMTREEGRGVTQYTLNLNPRQKQELWRLLDDYAQRGYIWSDFFANNCTSLCFDFIRRPLLGERLEVRAWPEVMRRGGTEAFMHYLDHSPWMLFVLFTLVGSRADEPTPIEHCVAPAAIGDLLSHAVIVSPDGTERPVLQGEPRQLLPHTLKLQPIQLTPLRLSVALLAVVVLLTLGQWLWGWRRIALTADAVLLAVQALLGLLMVCLLTIGRLFEQHWNWCLFLFTPLPLVAWLCWRRRRWYRRLALLYGGILLLLAVAAPLFTVQLLAAHRLTAALIAVRCFSCAGGKANEEKQTININNHKNK